MLIISKLAALSENLLHIQYINNPISVKDYMRLSLLAIMAGHHEAARPSNHRHPQEEAHELRQRSCPRLCVGHLYHPEASEANT